MAVTSGEAGPRPQAWRRLRDDREGSFQAHPNQLRNSANHAPDLNLCTKKSWETAGFLREFCVNQSRTVVRRAAFNATGAPANRLIQLKIQFMALD